MCLSTAWSRHVVTIGAVLCGLAFGAPTTSATEAFELTPSDGPMRVSAEGLDTNKVKTLYLPDGTVLAIYGLAQDVGQPVMDVQSHTLRSPFDIVVSYSLDTGLTWSSPLNISNSAALSSGLGIVDQTGAPVLGEDGHPDLTADPRAIAWPGDCDKPNAFNTGNNILVTWGSKYCPSGEQRFVVYPGLNGVTIPYSCAYASRLQWNPTTKSFKVVAPPLPFKTERLSSGLRDMKQDANKGAQPGFIVTWQEDARGLKLGDAEGPGHGASGANVHQGTDVWYTMIDTAANTDFINPMWSTPVRVTRNTISEKELQAGHDTETHPGGLYDHGYVGASRPNNALIGKTALVTYEETKGTLGWEEGKYVRFHTFPFAAPPEGGEVGCIISEPYESAQRVRVLTQPLSEGQTALVFLYRQGNFTHGGPADIMVRRAVGGLGPEHLVPAIDPVLCRSSRSVGTDPLVELAASPNHLPALNFSGSADYLEGTGTAPDAASGDNPYENALAHRGIMRGDFIMLGYSYTPDLYEFLYLDDAVPFDFYLRRSLDGGATWSEPYNLSKLDPSFGVSVREPRIVPTPSSSSNCPDMPENCQDPDVVYVGFGLQTNEVSQVEPVDVDIYLSVTLDAGETFSDLQPLTMGDVLGGAPDLSADWETQMKIRPDGREAYIAWSCEVGGADLAVYRTATVRIDKKAITMLDESEGGLEVIADTSTPRIANAAVVDAVAVSGAESPDEVELPFGVLDFTVTGLEPGEAVTVVLTVAEPLPEGTTLWKFGPTLGDPTAHWYSVPAVFGETTVTFTVVDGQDGDADLVANGTIEDPVAIGVPGPVASGSGCASGETGLASSFVLITLAVVLLLRRRAAMA